MRIAAILDAWKALRKSSQRPIRQLEFKWEGITRLSDGEAIFVQPVTLICGENGAGKSTLLHALYDAIRPEAAVSPRPHGGRVAKLVLIVGNNHGGAVTLEGEAAVRGHFVPEEDPPLISLIDTGMAVPYMLSSIRTDANFDDHLEGAVTRTFSDIECKQASFVIGRDYDEIVVHEVENSSFEDVFPYFEVRVHGSSYRSQDMGDGELAVLYLMWMISRCPRGSLLLVEEPEAFLSPRAQVALIDVMAHRAVREAFTLVMTSHSGQIATRLANSEIIYVTRSRGTVSLENPARTSALVGKLGLRPERDFVYFVEDELSELVTRTIVDRYSAVLAGQGEFVRANGEGNVRRALSVLPATLSKVAFVGILDGDQRNGAGTQEGRIVFLPGTVPPDAMLRAFSLSLAEAELAGMLAVSAEDLRRALAEGAGQDLHDWPRLVAAGLGMVLSEFVRKLVVGWCERSPDETRGFISELEAFSAATQ